MLFALLQGVCQAEPALTITLGGDVILGRDGEAIFTEDPWGGLSTSQIAQKSGDNWFMVNLESPLAGDQEAKVSAGEGYNLCAPAEAAEILEIGGVDLVTAANNHQDDCAESAETTQQREIPHVVEGQPFKFESPAGTVIVIAADAVSKPLDMIALLENIADLSTKSDMLIVSLHWGKEYSGQPVPLQKEQARQLADAGVDILWGHHPHVLQPIEWVESGDGNHRMLAIYSLGNLLTDQMMTLETRRSALVHIQIQGGEITRLSFQPLVLTQTSGRLALAYPDEEAASQIGKRLGWAELMASFP